MIERKIMCPTTFHPNERVLSPPPGTHGEHSCLRVVDGVYEDGRHVFISYWKPEPEDIERLKQGKGIYLAVLSDHHGPVLMTTDATSLGLEEQV